MSLRESIEGATRRYAEDCVRWAGPRGFLKDDPSPDTGYDFPQVGEDIIAAFEQALLQPEVVEAAAEVVHQKNWQGAYTPLEWDEEIDDIRSAIMLDTRAALQAALAAMGTVTEEEQGDE